MLITNCKIKLIMLVDNYDINKDGYIGVNRYYSKKDFDDFIERIDW